MKRTLQIAVVFCGLGLTAVVAARPEARMKLLNDSGFNNTSIGLTCAVTDAQEVNLRQSVYVHSLGQTDSHWQGATRTHYDFQYADIDFGPSKLRLFVGANADYIYGSRINDSLMAGPEAGFKVDVQPTALVVVTVGYQSRYQDGKQVDEALNAGFFRYSIGIGFRF